MKRNISVKLVFLWILAFLPVIAVLLCYRSLPAEIPTHWGIDGTVNGTGARWTMLIIACLSPICTAGMFFTRHIDPKKENYSRFSEAYEVFIFVFNLFMLIIISAVLLELLYPNTIDISAVVIAAAGVLITIIGNIMPKFKHNYFIGIRTPWTLASETVWYRTHRLSGVLWVIGGLVMIAGVFFARKISFIILLCDVLAISIIPCVMSYVWFRQKK